MNAQINDYESHHAAAHHGNDSQYDAYMYTEYGIER